MSAHNETAQIAMYGQKPYAAKAAFNSWRANHKIADNAPKHTTTRSILQVYTVPRT